MFMCLFLGDGLMRVIRLSGLSRTVLVMTRVAAG